MQLTVMKRAGHLQVQSEDPMMSDEEYRKHLDEAWDSLSFNDDPETHAAKVQKLADMAMEQEQGSSSKVHTSVNITASTARSSATETNQDMTTTHALSTDIFEAEPDHSEGAKLLRGLRKRWIQRSEKPVEIDNDFELVQYVDQLEDLDESSALPVPASVDEFVDDTNDRLDLVDAAHDDFHDTMHDPVQNTKVLSKPHAALAGHSTSFDVFKYPWEKGRLAGFFGHASIVKTVEPKLLPGGLNDVRLEVHVDAASSMAAKVKVKEQDDTLPSFAQVIKKAEDISAADERVVKRRHVLKLWWELLATTPEHSSVGTKVLAETDADNCADYGMEVLDATFAVKAPGTLLKRYYALKSFAAWLMETEGADWQPIAEGAAWRYVRYLSDSKAPPTRASSFMEGLRFAHYLLGVTGAGEAEHSLRVRGLALQMRSKKRPWRPADTLTLDEVRRLHRILSDKEVHLGDRIFTGHLLHMLYGRCRWSDLVLVNGLFMDEERHFMEVTTRTHKGAKSAELKARLLPIVAPSIGVTPHNWAFEYMELRRMANMSDPGEEYEPMLGLWNGHGGQ